MTEYKQKEHGLYTGRLLLKPNEATSHLALLMSANKKRLAIKTSLFTPLI